MKNLNEFQKIETINFKGKTLINRGNDFKAGFGEGVKLNQFNELVLEEDATNVLDKGAKIYGNWVYNVAYAGCNGMIAYAQFFESINEIKNIIAEGIPVTMTLFVENIG